MYVVVIWSNICLLASSDVMHHHSAFGHNSDVIDAVFPTEFPANKIPRFSITLNFEGDIDGDDTVGVEDILALLSLFEGLVHLANQYSLYIFSTKRDMQTS